MFQQPVIAAPRHLTFEYNTRRPSRACQHVRWDPSYADNAYMSPIFISPPAIDRPAAMSARIV